MIILTKKLKINKNLIESDPDNLNMTIVPVDKETNLVFINVQIYGHFSYEKSKAIYTWIIIIVIILVLAIIIGLLIYRKKKKEENNNIVEKINMNENILSDN